MGRGVSSGGGQSSLGYLFGSGEAPKAEPGEKPAPIVKQPPAPVDNTKQVPAGIQSSQANNYTRADGQNTGNFITHDWNEKPTVLGILSERGCNI